MSFLRVKFAISQKLLIAFLITINIVLLYILMLPSHTVPSENNFAEISELRGDESFGKLKKFFQDLAHKKGAVYAYEVLKVAHVKPGTDMHLLGHAVGEILYEQKGAEGMMYCTEDFRNACSHTIVVGLFSEKGTNAIPEIVKACQKAPGGKGAYGMCFHGLGHGVFAYTGYELPKTVELCQRIGQEAMKGPELPECVGGMTMELITGGDHDRKLWEQQSKKYLSNPDPLYPCNTDIIPNEAKKMCFIYLTPHLFVRGGADLRRPTEENYEKAFVFCNNLTDPSYREACYGGFGKEFVVLARNRDIRKIEEMSKDELKTVITWCNLSDTAGGKEACYLRALGSLYWGGENHYDAAIQFCSLLDSATNQEKCFSHLIGMVFYYENDRSYIKEFCSKLPNSFQDKCRRI